MDIENHDAVAALLLLHQHAPPPPQAPHPQHQQQTEQKEAVEHGEDQTKKIADTGGTCSNDRKNNVNKDNATKCNIIYGIQAGKEKPCCNNDDNTNVIEEGISQQNGGMDVNDDTGASTTNASACASCHGKYSDDNICTNRNDNGAAKSTLNLEGCGRTTNINVDVSAASTISDTNASQNIAAENNTENKGKESHVHVTSISCSTDTSREDTATTISSSTSILRNENKKINCEGNSNTVSVEVDSNTSAIDQEKAELDLKGEAKLISPKLLSSLPSSQSSCDQEPKSMPSSQEEKKLDENKIVVVNDDGDDDGDDDENQIKKSKFQVQEINTAKERKHDFHLKEDANDRGKEPKEGSSGVGDDVITEKGKIIEDSQLQSQSQSTPSSSLSLPLSSPSCSTKLTPPNHHGSKGEETIEIERKEVVKNDINAKTDGNNVEGKDCLDENRNKKTHIEEMANPGIIETIEGCQNSAEKQHQQQQCATITKAIISSSALVVTSKFTSTAISTSNEKKSIKEEETNTSVPNAAIQIVDKELPVSVTTVINPSIEKQISENDTSSAVVNTIVAASIRTTTQSDTKVEEQMIQPQCQERSDEKNKKSPISTLSEGKTEATMECADISSSTIDSTEKQMGQPQAESHIPKQQLVTSTPTNLGQNNNDNPTRVANIVTTDAKQDVGQSSTNLTHSSGGRIENDISNIKTVYSSSTKHGNREKELKTLSPSLEKQSSISSTIQKSDVCSNSDITDITIINFNKAPSSNLRGQHQQLQESQQKYIPSKSSATLSDLKSSNVMARISLSHQQQQQQQQQNISLTELNGDVGKNQTNDKDDNSYAKHEVMVQTNNDNMGVKKMDSEDVSSRIQPNTEDTAKKAPLHATDDSKEDNNTKNSNTDEKIDAVVQNKLEDSTEKIVNNDSHNVKSHPQAKSLLHTASSTCIAKLSPIHTHISPHLISISPCIDPIPATQKPPQPIAAKVMSSFVTDEESDYENKISKIKRIATSVQKLKIELYLDAMKVHRGKGAERKFADYWDAFGRYVSAPYSVPCSIHPNVKISSKRPDGSIFHQNNDSENINMRSNSDITTNGIEAILNSFLITKSLKKKHNALVRAVMNQCFHDQVLESRVQTHIPVKWNKRIRKIDRGVYNNNRKNINGESISSLDRGASDFMKYFDSRERNIFFPSPGQIRSSDIPTIEAVETVQYSSIERSSTARLPAMMEIEYLSREVMQQTDHSLTPNGLWFVTVAVKEYISKILKSTMAVMKSEGASVSSGDNSDYTTNTRKRKRCKITPLDIVKSLDVLTCEQTSPSSRMAWERCISEIGVNSVFELNNTSFDDFQNHVNKLLAIASEKRRKVTVSSNKPSEVSVGKGKDLAAMVVRRKSEKAEETLSIIQEGNSLERRTSIPPSLNAINSRRPSFSYISESNSQLGKPPSRPPSAFASDGLDSKGSRSCSPASNLLLSTATNTATQPFTVEVTKRPSSPIGRNSKNLAAMLARNNSSRPCSPKGDKEKGN